MRVVIKEVDIRYLITSTLEDCLFDRLFMFLDAYIDSFSRMIEYF